MTSAEPVRPAAPRAGLQASVLAALQLVEDARSPGGDRLGRSARARRLADRAVVSRRLALRDGPPDLAG